MTNIIESRTTNHEPRITLLLAIVSRRRRIQAMIDGFCLGLFYGALIATGFLFYRWFGGTASIPLWLLAGVACIGTVFGGLFGTLRPLPFKESARQIDAHYRLKDRFLTALQGIHHPSNNPMERLQLEDTAKHALQVDPQTVVPLRRPRQLFPALATVLMAVVFCHASVSGNLAKTSRSTPSEFFAGVEQTLIDRIAELLRKNSDEPELQSLTDELKQLNKFREGETTDPKEVLAALSRMETHFAKAINEFNLQAVDLSMQEVAESLLSAEATLAAALALKAEDYGKAADKLEKIDFTELSDTERAVLADNLRQNAADAALRKLPNLDKLLKELAGEIEKGDDVGSRASSTELADFSRKQQMRKELSSELDAQANMLGIYKMQMTNDRRGNSTGDSTTPSDNPGNQAGTGSDGQPQGDQATDAIGNLQQEQITGIHGSGPSEIEIIHSGETTDATTVRTYVDAHRDFQRISEAVLESEPIPLGQRRMIRTYFERIRPKEY